MKGRKVRTPKSSIAANGRHPVPIPIGIVIGQVQQKECTGNAVANPGKLYAVQCQVYPQLSATRALWEGRQIERLSNVSPR